MARMSKRKRETGRFGGPECLADLVLAGRWAEMCGDAEGRRSGLRPPESWTWSHRRSMSAMCGLRVLDYTRVFDLCEGLEADTLGFRESVRGVIPGCDGCFAECRIPSWKSPQVRGVGWSLDFYAKGTEPGMVYDAMLALKDPGAYARCELFAVGSMALRMRTVPGSACEGVVCPTVSGVVMLDGGGNAIHPPQFEVGRHLIDIG